MRTSVYLSIFFSTFFSACFRSLCGVKRTDGGQWLLPRTFIIPGTQFYSPSQGGPQIEASGTKQRPLCPESSPARPCPGVWCPWVPGRPHHELLLLPVMDFGLLLSLLLQGGCYCLVLPTNLMSQAPQVSKLRGKEKKEVLSKRSQGGCGTGSRQAVLGDPTFPSRPKLKTQPPRGLPARAGIS